jgi:N-methylhydantoinase B/oxoprolinase/acetone carboxylase alpha subunit/acetone carboxylase gamma subunit
MATITEPRAPQTDEPGGIGWDGHTLQDMLDTSDRLFADTGHYYGLRSLTLKESDPLQYEKLFSRVRGGMVSARETAMNISASPIVRELGEICFALYTPEGDSIALSTGIIVHVHTMSEAIKFMVRNGWENNPGIEAGDIFANNQPTIGDVHNADVQTFVPIFNPENPTELLAWAGGVIHVMDIGAATPGGVPIAPTTRYEDGIDLHCMKTGQRDELAAWHVKRVTMMSRAPGLWMLDEKTRLAGCHMIRDVVERLVAEEGAELLKQFMREAIEDGRRSFKSRVREMTVPGRYREPNFVDFQFAGKQRLPKRSQRDFIMHGCYEAEVGEDGHWTTNLEGSSAWGWHAFNATPSANQGMQWLLFTQTLICNDKINDGAYYATTLKITPNSWCDVADNPGSSAIPWSIMLPAWTGYCKAVSRGLQARGYVEEVIGSYNFPGNVCQGGGIDQYGQINGFLNFEIGASGMGAKYVADGLDYGSAAFNPEGDMGDCEMWEMAAPIIYLSRSIQPYSAGAGRHRGGSAHTSLYLVYNTPDYELENLCAGQMFLAPGLFGGYPSPTNYIHNVFGADLIERAQRGEAYPLTDYDRENRQLDSIGGRHDVRQDAYSMLQAFDQGDLYLSVGKGTGGLGDPLLRPVDQVQRDLDEGHLLPRFAESVYGVSDRPSYRARRLQRARPASEWWALQRERVLERRLSNQIKVMLAESMLLSPEFAAEYRGFWDLPEDFEFGVACPTLPIASAAPGKITPEESASAYLARARAFKPEGEVAVPVVSTMSKETLADLLDENLSRRAVKDIQSSIKDPDRFDKWVAVLQERASYADPIVLPFGEGLNIVRRASDGELVIRTDAGADLCRPDQNWKMHTVMYVRDSVESYREIYPELGHPDPEWQELREYYCPISGQLLETEAVPPGYPVVHQFLPDIEGFYRGWLGRELP